MAASHVLCLKGTGVAFVGLTAALALVVILRAKRFDGRALAPAVLAASVGSFWVVRNVAHTGNPLYPVAIAWHGHPWLAGVGSLESVLDVAHNTPSSWLALSRAGARAARVAAALQGRQWTSMRARRVSVTLGRSSPCPALGALLYGLLRTGAGSSREGPPASLLGGRDRGLLSAPADALVGPVHDLALGPGRGCDRARARKRGLVRDEPAPRTPPCSRSACWWRARGLSRSWRCIRTPVPARDETLPSGLPATFFRDEIEGRATLCRGAWKPGTDNVLLDGVAAQLRPRPRVFVIADDDGDWSRVRRQWKEAGCEDLLLFRGSPVLGAAADDPGTALAPTTAFDAAFVARAR